MTLLLALALLTIGALCRRLGQLQQQSQRQRHTITGLTQALCEQYQDGQRAYARIDELERRLGRGRIIEVVAVHVVPPNEICLN